ncbi:MAG: TonB-dependent receptor [Cyclobacteriaceae bacterium]|nr:TonB-dependent receptor [Cyclobacteriaceae bacterium]
MKNLFKNYRYILSSLFLLSVTSTSLYAQVDKIEVTGRVIDNNSKEGLPGATVLIKRPSDFTITNSNGEFSIAVKNELPISIEISLVGFKKQEIQLYEFPDEPLEVVLVDDILLDEIIVTSRRRKEEIQEVPIPISVVSGAVIDNAGAFNVNRLKELVPTVQLYSSNPRNTTLNIRGLGSTFGLTNDGIDPGVGFYIDGVYYARPAVTQLDFIDVEQIEILRGPQGTLFGKNTTAGAFNITTRKASFTPGANFELSYGNYGFIQAKTSVTGPLSKTLAARVSFSGTQRDGLLYNVATQKPVNDINNLGFRGQLLYAPNDKLEITLAADASRQRPDGFAQIVAGVVTTQRPAFRQFENIIADLNYDLPTRNPFDRKVDHDTPWRSGNDLGGVSLNIDYELGPGVLTSTTAWRYWDWDPSNDRDFTGLQVLALSQAPSRHTNWSQEIRYAGDFTSSLSGVVGVFAMGQDLRSTPYHTEEAGEFAWRFFQNNANPLWETPGLLNGYGARTTNSLESFSGAVFANLDWKITDKLHFLPGLRYNYDAKEVFFSRETYGGLQTEDLELLALKNSVYNNQEFDASVDESNFSGQVTLAYKATEKVNSFITYSTSFKPVGVNLGGLPRSGGVTMIELARINPEYVTHLEIGIKTNPTPRSTFNVMFHNTEIKDFQTLVQTPDPGVNRGYLANAEEVRVVGVEIDVSFRFSRHLSVFTSIAYTDGKYVRFTNAPVPLEEVGGEAFKDISGQVLPGISKWAASFGGEALTGEKEFLGQNGKFFLAVDGFYRSTFSSSASPSLFLNIEGYTLINSRLGFRATDGLSVFLWARNLLDKDYFEQLLPAGGSAGHYAAVLGDQRTFGITIHQNFKKK